MMDSHRHRAELRARREFRERMERLAWEGAFREWLRAARLWLRPLACAGGGFVGALLSNWGMHPFGIALGAALIGSPLCPAACIGAAVGYVALGGAAGLGRAAACLAILLGWMLLRGTERSGHAVLGPALAAVLTLPAAAVTAQSRAGLILSVCEAVLAGGITLLLRTVLYAREGVAAGARRETAAVVTAALVLGALQGTTLFGLQPGEVLLCAAVLWLMLFRRETGMLLALCGGLMLDAAAGRGPAALAVIPLAAGAANLFLPAGRTAACAAWLLGGTLAALWTGGEVSVVSVLIGGACGLFLPIPAKRQEDPARRMQALAESRLDSCAAAYDSVCAALRREGEGGPANLENPAEILRLAAEEACAACPRSPECWGRCYQTTRDQLCACLRGLMTRGRVLREDLPPPFSAACIRFAEFLSALNRELCVYLYRSRLQAALEESREILCAQYGDFSRLLREQAAAVGKAMRFHPREERRLMRLWSERGMRVSATVYSDEHGRLSAELEGTGTARFTAAERDETDRISKILGRPMMLAEVESGCGGTRLYFREYDRLRLEVHGACGCAPGQRMSGDRAISLRLRSGRCYILFSDGMGHGAEAAAASRRALQLLESYLRAGVTAELALHIVTGALLLRDGGTAFATLDMLEFDPVSGEASLYKCGAAPTWLIRSGKVERLPPAGEPLGLSLAPAERRRVLLRPGDRVVMVSDGISDGEEDAWVDARLEEFSEGNAQELAEALLFGADAADDRTVLAVTVSAREES